MTAADAAPPAMVEVVTAGETMALLSTPERGRLRHAPHLRLGVAGAESNAAIALSRLGVASRWISRVGDDELGHVVAGAVAAEGVDVSGVVRAPGERTGLFLRDQVAGRTRVHYYRSDSAATRLAPESVPVELLTRARVLHLTGVTPALSERCAAFVRWAVEVARGAGVTVSFDVNYRSKLWPADQARKAVEALLDDVDLLFASDEDATALWGVDDAATLGGLLAEHRIEELIVKHGTAATAWTPAAATSVDAFAVSDVVDPIGAGDAFAAGYLAARAWGADVDERLRTAHAMGALCVAAAGDYEGLPHRDELDAFLTGRQELGR